MQNVSVIIPVFNQVHLTERCLVSLLAHSHQVREVFIIDNASRDDTEAFLQKIAAHFREKNIFFQVITNEKNTGFGRACNQGIRLASGDFVAILNNDTWQMPGWDEVLAEKLKESDIDCIGPYFYEGPFDESTLAKRAQEFTQRNQKKIRAHFMPILMFFKKEAIQKLKFDHGGIFDERFFVTYEDTDLKERMLGLNLRFAQTGSCFIWHHSMGTRNAKKDGIALLPSGYEKEGLKLFMEKWGFDPRPRDHTFTEKLKRRYWKWKEQHGLF
jgi:GT2 family glycosyltransferase